MNGLILALIPLALAAAFQPPQIIALLVLLQTKRGVLNGLAYIAGMFVFRLVLGFVFWFLVSSVEESVESTGGRFVILVSAVLMVLGLLLLINALRRAFSTPDEGQASWLDSLEHVSPLRAAFMGVVFLALDPKDWITDLAAVNLIADADLGVSSSLFAYLIFLLLAKTLLLIPLILMLITPKQADRVLGNLNGWMKKHARSIEIITAIIFGLIFLVFGLRGLGLV
jgi:threonine/homoserine/homoserine lactone efflux protein